MFNPALIHTSSLVLFKRFISRVPDQNGVSPLYIMLEIHHSGQKPSILFYFIFQYQDQSTDQMTFTAVSPFEDLMGIGHFQEKLDVDDTMASNI